jgi:LPXTG-motif cell wall-anchored protein
MSLNDFDDTQFEDFSSEEEMPTEGSPEPSGGGNGGNRNFMLAVGIIGAIFVISLIGLGLYIFLGQPNQTSSLRETAAVINANNTATAMSATDSARLNIESLTKTAGAPTNTPIPATNTPVIAIPSATPNMTATALAGALADPAGRTATVAAFQTQVALGTQITGTSTALPQTGFAEDIGLPGLLGAAAILLLVIFLARRLRLSQS